MKFKITLFFIAIIGMLAYLKITVHSGELTGYIPSTRIGEIETGHRNDNIKAVIGKDTVDYYAASSVRCDELYKFCHFIGQGHMTGSVEVLNFYVPNDNYRLITVEQMLAEQLINKNNGKR